MVRRKETDRAKPRVNDGRDGGEANEDTEPSPRSRWGRPDGKPSKANRILERVVILALLTLALFGVRAFVARPYVVPTGSMEPTIRIGQHVLASPISVDFGRPHVGGIYVFHPPQGADQEQCGPAPHHLISVTVKMSSSGRPIVKNSRSQAACDQPIPHRQSQNFIKRLVAGPGDEIYISDGHVYRKAAGTDSFVREKDPYIRQCGSNWGCNFPKAIKIPPGHWFMMGDNRGGSDDSRYWGPVPTSWIIGEAFATYWPPDRIGFF